MKDLCQPQLHHKSVQFYNHESAKKLRPKSVGLRGRQKLTSDQLSGRSPTRVDLGTKINEEVISEEELIILFKARCKDMNFPVNLDRFERFKRYISKSSCNGKLKLVNLGLADASVETLIHIIAHNPKIRRIYLGKNKLYDKGAELIAKLIKESENLIHIDISSNCVTHIGFRSIFQSLLNNNTIVSLNLSSTDMSQRNRLGTKGAKMLTRLMKCSPYIQYLNVSSTALCNEGAKILLEGLNGNQTLLSLIIKANEITHVIVKEFICACIIGSNIEYLDFSYNNLGNHGISDF